MTDLKDLLEHAAGDEPAITETLLDADVSRGRRSVRRRRGLGLAAAAAGTAAAVTAAFLFAPGGPQAEPEVASTATTTPTNEPMTSPDYRLPPEELLPFAGAARPVKLVRDGAVRPGTDLVCDLKPEGWKVKVWPGDSGNTSTQLTYYHPTLHDTGRYHENSTQLEVSPAGFRRGDHGELLMEKAEGTWEQQKNRHRVGTRELVTYGGTGPETAGVWERREVLSRVTRTKLIQVNGASSLGWDMPTLLRFTASCHFSG